MGSIEQKPDTIDRVVLEGNEESYQFLLRRLHEIGSKPLLVLETEEKLIKEYERKSKTEPQNYLRKLQARDYVENDLDLSMGFDEILRKTVGRALQRNIPIPRERMQECYHAYYAPMIEQYIKRAERYGIEGKADDAAGYIESALRLAQEAGISVDSVRLDQLREEIYKKGVEMAVQEAKADLTYLNVVDLKVEKTRRGPPPEAPLKEKLLNVAELLVARTPRGLETILESIENAYRWAEITRTPAPEEDLNVVFQELYNRKKKVEKIIRKNIKYIHSDESAERLLHLAIKIGTSDSTIKSMRQEREDCLAARSIDYLKRDWEYTHFINRAEEVLQPATLVKKYIEKSGDERIGEAFAAISDRLYEVIQCMAKNRLHYAVSTRHLKAIDCSVALLEQIKIVFERSDPELEKIKMDAYTSVLNYALRIAENYARFGDEIGRQEQIGIVEACTDRIKKLHPLG